jgi:hypothetical protein
MKLVYVGFEFAHHKDKNGGYDLIGSHLRYDIKISVQKECDYILNPRKTICSRIFKKIYQVFLGEGTPIGVLRCIYRAIFYKNQVFHFIYAENTYKWLNLFKGKSNKIVCTFHQPKSFFTKNKHWIDRIKHIDEIILLSKSDIIFFENITGKKNVHFIPHGINTNFYFYNSSIPRKKSILLVGNWLRDFNFASEIFNILLGISPQLEINVVSNKSNNKYFKNQNVNFYNNISDDELKAFYQSSKVVFFPLFEYTANNAILEAAACGCNIIVATPNQVDNTYFSSEYIDFFDMDTSKVIKRILMLLDENDFTQKAQKLSEFVKRTYSWNSIALETKKILLQNTN